MSTIAPDRLSGERLGYVTGIGACLLWGFFPLYFHLLDDASPIEVLAQRIVWSLLVCVLLVALTRGWVRLWATVREGRILALLAVASATICANWGLYIWAVNNDHVVEAALGYFINPLVSVLLGVVVLRERLRPLQWWAFGIAVVAVVVLTVGYGQPPWVALALAASFAVYGLCKKLAGAESVSSLTVETALATPFALAYLIALGAIGNLTFGHATGTTLLMTTLGVVTVAPLLAFNTAATRIPLSAVGLMQYLMPILQFLLGVTVFGEHMPPARWAGFVIVWIALVFFTVDAVRHSRREVAVPDL